ncbi:hypothetical protein [Kitasatospora sp. NPDC056181]|uniref:hypothetical protein n=1 Tax=Kitasatospora sp. NPDC056181 TaxID=3345737 RepID=UPI0035DA6D5B
MLTTDPPAARAPAAPPPSVARRPLLPAAGVDVLLLCVALSLALGSRAVPLPTVLDALTGGGHGADETWMSGIGVQAADAMLGDIAKAVGVDAPK